MHVERFSFEVYVMFFSGQAGGTVQGGGSSPERPALGPAVWMWGQLVACGPATAQNLVPVWPCSLSLVIMLQQSCRRGHQSSHEVCRLWRSPGPTGTQTLHARPWHWLLLACTPEGHGWSAQSLWASSGLAKPANSSARPRAEPHLLYWSLNPW